MNKSPKTLVCFAFFLFCFSFFSSGAYAAYGPQAYVTEYVSQNYWYNGTPKGADARTGTVEVSVPNNWDTLQYVRVNLTGANMSTSTNLVNSTAYDNVVTSWPTTNNKDTIYVNTSASASASSYTMNDTNLAPTINLSLGYVNYFGGTDLWGSDNIWPSGSANAQDTVRFNLTIRNPSTTRNLTNVNVVLQFAVDKNGVRDAVNITVGTNTTTGPGTNVVSNNDGGDSDFERISWTGYLNPSALVYIVFNATTTAGTSFTGDYVNLDSNDKGGLANYTNNTNVHTNLSINYKLARGAIREGVDLQISGGTWYARGLIRNMANESPNSGNVLTYNITGWRIYSVDPSTGAPYTDPNITGTFSPSQLTPADSQITTTTQGRSNNTNWYDTASPTKPYIAAYFDWYVEWNDTISEYYVGYINTTLDAPNLYVVDMLTAKTLTGVIYPQTGGQSVTVQDNVTYNGNSSIGVGNITVYSVVPVNTSTNAFHGLFSINTSTVKVYYVNATGMWQLKADANVNWTVTQPTYYANNGSVVASIRDLSTAAIVGGTTVGKNLTLTAVEKIVLQYDVSSNSSMDTGDTYAFIGNASFNTTSGTQESEIFTPASITVSTQRLQGYKELFIPDPSNPTKVNATLFVQVDAQGSQTISGIKFIDYVVNGTFNNNATLYGRSINVTFFNQVSTVTWTYLTNYNVTFNGTRQLTDGTWVEVFEFINITGSGGGFILNNTQNITVKYQMTVSTPGTYILPLQIAAFDPITGADIGAQYWGVIRVNVPETAVPLTITDHNLELAKRVVVGTPAIWIKNFEVYNPNGRAVSSSFQTTVFGDAMDGFVSYYDDRGEKIEEAVTFGNVENGKKAMSWESTLNAMETRTYEVRILTPPVMEIDRDIEVMDKLENKMVKLKMDVYLKSFSEERYSNIILNLPIGYENVMEVKDGFGKPLQFSGSKDTSSIIVDEIEPSGMKTVSIIYKASYPTIIITPDRDRYDLSAPVSLEILVINGGETIDYPYVEVEVYTPGMDVIYSNLARLKTIEPLEKTQTYEKFVIPANAPGGMYVASARFREDFTVLASTTGNFFVAGSGTSTPEALQIIAVLAITGVLAYFSFKRLKEVRRTRRLLEGVSPLS